MAQPWCMRLCSLKPRVQLCFMLLFCVFILFAFLYCLVLFHRAFYFSNVRRFEIALPWKWFDSLTDWTRSWIWWKAEQRLYLCALPLWLQWSPPQPQCSRTAGETAAAERGMPEQRLPQQNCARPLKTKHGIVRVSHFREKLAKHCHLLLFFCTSIQHVSAWCSPRKPVTHSSTVGVPGLVDYTNQLPSVECYKPHSLNLTLSGYTI